MSTRALYLPYILFLTLGIIWGSNFIYMKVASSYISPIQIVFYRVVFGFFPVLFYALYSKVLRLSHFKHSVHFFMMAMLATAVYYFCFVKGASLLLSGVAGAVSGSIPLFSFILAVLFLEEERASCTKCIGILVGFAGVVIIGWPVGADMGETNFSGVLYMVLGSLSVGASFVYAKKVYHAT